MEWIGATKYTDMVKYGVEAECRVVPSFNLCPCSSPTLALFWYFK